jgi:hypothetical protein
MQSRARIVALFLILGGLVAFTARQQALILPPPPAEILASHTAIVLQLPDTGGIAINHQPISWKNLDRLLDTIYGVRPVKVLLVDAAPLRTRDEIERVRQSAVKRQIKVYAASANGIRR